MLPTGLKILQRLLTRWWQDRYQALDAVAPFPLGMAHRELPGLRVQVLQVRPPQLGWPNARVRVEPYQEFGYLASPSVQLLRRLGNAFQVCLGQRTDGLDGVPRETVALVSHSGDYGIS